MRIAVNTRLLIKNRLEGIGWFTFESFKRITRLHPEHEFFFLFDRDFDQEFVFSSNVTPIKLNPQARHPILWYFWFEYSVRHFIEKNKIDLFISTDGYLSLKTNIPQIAVIHDINFFHFPKTIPPFARWYYNHYFPKFSKKSIRIATVSEFSKKDIVKSYGIDPDKIDVVYNGANEKYTPLSEEEVVRTRAQISEGNPYFVFVGAFNPRKNISRLLQAFDQFKSQHQSNIKLIIVGEEMYGTSEMISILKKLRYKDDIIFTGRLDVERLRLVIGSALAMTYVSYYEGFGIPLLEAMKCGVPIVASDQTSIPEVAGDAAIYVNPFSPESISEGMNRIVSDANLRDQLIKNAAKQRQKFSWDKTANEFYNCITKVLNR